MSKMGSHDPFGHFKHKLWPKERSKVKLPIWFPTTKSLKLPWFPCMQGTCDIPLESSWQWLKLCFRLHVNQRSAPKIMGPQSRGSPNFGNFGTSTLDFGEKNAIWVMIMWPSIEHTIRGKVVTSPKSGPW
jgi:hypothetical protein